MKTDIFLDSSFFFPFINIEVDGCEKSDIKKLLRNKDIRILRSEITIFELSAKGTKLVNEGKIDFKDLVDGLNTLQFLKSVKVIPIFYSEIQLLALKFRMEHSDFIDCLLLASAINYAHKFVTLDKILIEKFHTLWKSTINDDHDEFEISLWKDFIYKIL